MNDNTEMQSLRILEWVAIPFSRGSSHPRDETWVSCITGKFFTAQATGKVLIRDYSEQLYTNKLNNLDEMNSQKHTTCHDKHEQEICTD